MVYKNQVLHFGFRWILSMTNSIVKFKNFYIDPTGLMTTSNQQPSTVSNVRVLVHLCEPCCSVVISVTADQHFEPNLSSKDSAAIQFFESFVTVAKEVI